MNCSTRTTTLPPSSETRPSSTPPTSCLPTRPLAVVQDGALHRSGKPDREPLARYLPEVSRRRLTWIRPDRRRHISVRLSYSGWAVPRARIRLGRMAGTLYVVATPIGNLEDITLRALRVLREADLIACEDTRQTRKLLDHYGIEKPTVSYHEHNETPRAPELIGKLRGWSDHRAGLRRGHAAGFRSRLPAGDARRSARESRVEPDAGASAVLAALSASGLPTDAFRFAGFLPPQAAASARRRWKRYADEDCHAGFLRSAAPDSGDAGRYRRGAGRPSAGGGARADQAARGIPARHRRRVAPLRHSRSKARSRC